MLTIKSNRTTYHIDGLTIRTTAPDDNENKIAARGYVAEYAENACGTLTRSYRFEVGKSFESAAEALKYVETCARAYGRKVCKNCRAAAMAMILDEAHAEQDEREQPAEQVENPVAGLVDEWRAARAELHELERAENPDVTDRFGRVWSWWKGDLYRHCGNAAPKRMIGDFGLPTQAALDNPNYELCDICLDGRERHVIACKREWKCSHAACARIHLSEDIDEAYAENEARYEVARAEADAEQVVDFRIEIAEPDANLEVRSPLGRRYPTELRLDLTGPLLEVFVPRDEDDEAFALEREPDGFGVYDADDDGRLYWTIPLLELDEAKAFLREIADEAARVVAGTTFETYGGFELSKAAQDATDRIALRCAQLA